MADTYTTVLGITKPGQGDYFNAWHTPANLVFEMLADAIAGETALALTGDTTLTTTNGVDDSGRAYVIRVSSSDQHDRTITVPATLKTYVLVNDGAYRVKIKPAAGTATDVMPATEAVVRVTASKAVRVATSGWGLHSTAATTSGASATFTLTGLGQHFNDVMFVLDAVAASAGNLTIQPRTDAASGGTAFDTGLALTTARMGDVVINNYRVSPGGLDMRIAASAASPAIATAATLLAAHRTTGGIGSVVFATSSGAFNAGSIGMYLR